MSSISRREFLRISSLAAAGSITAACAQQAPQAPGVPAGVPMAPATGVSPTAAPAPVVPTGLVSRFGEAPMLAELVVKGELPPVDERLPVNPYEAQVAERIGKYGGTIRRAFTGVADFIGVGYAIGALGLTWAVADLSLRPTLCESWETNEDSSVWTWHLRKGTRWSDGEPFTSADFMWFWEHQLSNKELTKSLPAMWSAGSPLELAAFEAPDDNTVIIRYAAPRPMLAWSVRQSGPFVPSHYSAKYHASFAPEAALAKLVADAGFQSWDQLYHEQHVWYNHPDMPSLRPWHPQGKLSEELFVAERNPYFWQVDPEGQQLPYVDRMNHRMFSTSDVFHMWILNGEIDFQQRHVDLGNFTLLKEGEAGGDYKVVFGVDARSICFGPNLASNNARVSEFFGHRDVRLALSYAVNRDEMNEIAYDGLCTPRQYSPLSSSPNFYPKLTYAHLDYDPDLANQLLDEAGYSERDSEGYRRFRDGSGDTISFVVESYYQPGSAGEDACQLAIRYFADVGVKATYKYIDRSLYNERIAANDMEACWSYWNSRLVLPTVDDNNAGHFTGMVNDPCWAGGWRLWRLDPTNPNAIEPPEDHWVRKVWDIYFNQVAMEGDDERRNKLFEKLMDIWAEELPLVGYLGELPALTIVRDGLTNFLPGYPNESAFGAEHLLGTHTYFWENPEDH